MIWKHPNGLRALPNERRAVKTRAEHVLPLAPCCPVSGNPLTGSTVTLRYHCSERVLEVYSLKKYLEGYVGGHPNGTRNMEAMIQQIAQDCADALQMPVYCHAHLLLHPEQEMRLSVRAEPCASTSEHTSQAGSQK